jgi:hypothetical protein
MRSVGVACLSKGRIFSPCVARAHYHSRHRGSFVAVPMVWRAASGLARIVQPAQDRSKMFRHALGYDIGIHQTKLAADCVHDAGSESGHRFSSPFCSSTFRVASLSARILGRGSPSGRFSADSWNGFKMRRQSIHKTNNQRRESNNQTRKLNFLPERYRTLALANSCTNRGWPCATFFSHPGPRLGTGSLATLVSVSLIP